MTISLVPDDQDTVHVFGGDLSGMFGSQLVVTLEAGEEYDGIPYAVWATYSGERVSLAAVRRAGARARPAEAASLAGQRVTCPRCGTAMVEGGAQVRTTLFGLLVAGFSYMHLFFTPAGEKREVVLRPGEEATGFRCPQCGTLLLE